MTNQINVLTDRGNITSVDYDAVLRLMCDDIREIAHQQATDIMTDQAFYDLYCRLHHQAYGSDFIVN